MEEAAMVRRTDETARHILWRGGGVWSGGVWRGLLGVVALVVVLGCEARAQEQRVAVFDLAFVNFSQELDLGLSDAAEQARIRMLTDYLRELLAADPSYVVVDTSPVADELASVKSVYSCNLCEDKLARKVGADLSVTGTVTKISVLIQTIVLRGRDATTGAVLWQYHTDIRNNSDEAWRRGLKWLIDHRVLAGEAQTLPR